MNEKFNKNPKVEQLTKVVLCHGEEKGLIVKDPYNYWFDLRFKFYTIFMGTLLFAGVALLFLVGRRSPTQCLIILKLEVRPTSLYIDVVAI